MTSVRDAVYDKITKMLGPEQGAQLIREGLEEIGATELRTPDDCLLFASVLIARGGLIAAIGRSIKVKALMHGASE